MLDVRLSPNLMLQYLQTLSFHFWNLKQWAVLSLGHLLEGLKIHSPISPQPTPNISCKFLYTPRMRIHVSLRQAYSNLYLTPLEILLLCVNFFLFRISSWRKGIEADSNCRETKYVCGMIE